MYFVADVEGVGNVGMRETVGSLRAYFILSGVAGILSALRMNLLSTGIIGAIVEVITIALSLAFVYVGFVLSRLLRSSASHIATLLYVSAGWSVFAFLLSILGGPSTIALVTLILSLLIVWYLLKNVRRLAGEAHAAPSEPPVPAP
jgi:small-conductance mechanosensitive channel